MPLLIYTPGERAPPPRPVMTMRRREDFPDPSKSPQAEVNRLRSNTYTRLKPEFLQAAETIAQRYGMKRNQWLELMMERTIQSEVHNIRTVGPLLTRVATPNVPQRDI